MGKTIYYNEFDNGLQPCPYCGASPKLLKKKNKVYYECNGDCWASTKAHWDEADARTEWNSLKPREENSEYLECRYIDASELLEIAKDGCHPDFEQSLADLTSLRELIEDTPTAEVVEVVRCKNCRLRGTDRCPMYYEEVIGYEGEYGPVDTIIHHWSKDDDFCSYGEREESD